ncbi:RHS repeat domain-containing protein [Bdellovibrio sp. HCB209]|uniref:RHS repeat domain-containing protein n=1 Tax=Bdellovibrio sp. HCB209 TaxID=3394354 RepID=UPI0039B6C949
MRIFIFTLLAFNFVSNASYGQSCEQNRAQAISDAHTQCALQAGCWGGVCNIPTVIFMSGGYYCQITHTGPNPPYGIAYQFLLVDSRCASTPVAPERGVPTNPAGSCAASGPVEKTGSIVGVESQTLAEEVQLAGVPFSLYYHSGFQSGYSKDLKIKFRITPSTASTYAQTFSIETKRGGTTIDTATYSSLVADQWYEYLWNGYDATNTVKIGSESFEVLFTETLPSGSFTKTHPVKLAHFDANQFGVGGWLPSVLRYYDVAGKRLYYATGSAVDVEAKPFGSSYLYVADVNGSEVYIFDLNGRHVYTKTSMLGTTVLTFSYDSSGRLLSISDPFAKTTTFNRNLSGELTSITAPNLQITSVSLDSNGFVSGFTNSLSESYVMTYYGSQGLMQTFQKPNMETSTFTYNGDGLLTQDSHSGGYFFQIVRDLNSSSSNDTYVTSVMGRVDRINSNVDANGNLSRTHYRANGQSSGDSYVSYGTSTDRSSYTGPTRRTWAVIDDPRFGSMVRVPRYEAAMNGGSRTVEFTRAHTLSDPSNPFSITSLSIGSNLSGTATSMNTVYDPVLKKFTTTSGGGVTSESVIDDYERLVSSKHGNQEQVSFNYTNEKLTSIVQGARTTTFSYNSNDLLQSISNPLSQVTSFVYDGANRIYSVIQPDSRYAVYSYDGAGNLTGITPSGKPPHSFTLNSHGLVGSYNPPALSGVSTVNTVFSYNLDKQLTDVTFPSGKYINRNITSNGVISGLSTSSGNYSFNVDTTIQQPTYITYPSGNLSLYWFGNQLSGTYYNIGAYFGRFYTSYTATELPLTEQVLSYGPSGGNDSTISYTYDSDEKLKTAGAITLNYNTPNGQLTGTEIGSGSSIVTDSYTYNTFGEVTGYQASFGSTVIYELDLARDGIGRINGKSQVMNAVSSDYEYVFDVSGRLGQVSKNSSIVSNYIYDSNSNRNGGNVGVQGTSATYDDQDRLLTYNTLSFTYNADGVIETKTNSTTSQTVQYEYDVFGNLKQVDLPGGTVINYSIDAINRRVGKKVNGVVQKYWIYMDQYRIAAEMDAGGFITKRFVYGSKANIPDYMIMGGESYRIISDQLGSLRLVVKVSDGSILQRMDHDEFGRVIEDTNPGLIPFGFAGGLYDDHTQLVRFGVRDYDPEIGRWTAKDPINFEGGDANLFGYVENDPVNWVDTEGYSKNKPGNTIDNNTIGGGGGGSGGGAVVGMAAGTAIIKVLKPAGKWIGEKGQSGIRVLKGGLKAAEEMYEVLCKGAGGKPVSKQGYPGKMMEFPDKTTVGLRETSSKGVPTIDINIGGNMKIKIKFE